MMLDELKKVVIDQEIALKHFFETNDLVAREVSLGNLRGLLAHPNVLVITGVRRCGKSILAHQILSNQNYAHINFDDERLAGFTASDFDKLLQVFYQLKGKNVEYILFDEIQNVDSWELFITRLRLNHKIIITGSNAKMLSRELATHLTGRHTDFNLFPFSFSEYLKLQHIDLHNMGTQNEAVLTQEFDNYLQNGGFPETSKLGTAILSEIYGDVINNDIIFRHKIRHTGTFKEMAGYLYSNYGQIISFSKLKNVFQIKHLQTIKNYLDYLEETFLIFVLNKFSYKLKEQIIAPKKIYPVDAGLANHMTKNTFVNRGALLETTVFLELIRRKSYYFPQQEIYFWRDYDNCEVDFVVKENDKIKILIQVSESMQEMNTKAREVRGLEKAARELNCSNLLILTADEAGEEKIGNLTIKICPTWKWILNSFE